MNRGLKESLKGLSFSYEPNIYRKDTHCGPAVLFPIGTTDDGKSIINSRLFNPPKGEQKSHNIGPTGGRYWKHPGINYDPEKEVLMTEGIIDALSLIELGYQAIAVLSAGQKPENIDLSEFKQITLAFDSDSAGKKAFKRWHSHLSKLNEIEQLKAIALNQGTGDWNDLLLTKQNPGEYIQLKRSDLKTNAQLLMAESGRRWAEIYLNHWNGIPSIFEFDNEYYAPDVKKDKDGNLVLSACPRISNFVIRPKYHIVEQTNPDLPERQFCIEVHTKNRRKPIRITTTAEGLASGQSWETTFLKSAAGVWAGDRTHIIKLKEKIVGRNAKKKIPEVEGLSYIGYHIEADSYVFPKLTILPDGTAKHPDKEGFFRVTQQKYLKPFPFYPSPVLPVQQKDYDIQKLWSLAAQAWGNVGATAIAWMISCWFINYIKAQLGFFPFLAIYGEPSSGKTSLMETLNAFQCLDIEGVQFKDVDTIKGLTRRLSQLSGLCCTVIEANAGSAKNQKQKFFKILDPILTLYNNNSIVQTRAQTTQDNLTHDLEFHSSFLFSGNDEPFYLPAQKQRIISLTLDKDYQNNETHAAFDELLKLPLPAKACFFPWTMKHRSKIQEQWLTYYEEARDVLFGNDDRVLNARLVGNYAIPLAFHNLFCELMEIRFELEPFIVRQLQRKFEECQNREVDVGDQFFDDLQRLAGFQLDTDDSNQVACFSIDQTEQNWWVCEREHKIVINLGAAVKALKELDPSIRYAATDLQDPLRRRSSFYNKKQVKFSINGGRNLQGWLFEPLKLAQEIGSLVEREADDDTFVF